MTPVHTKEDDVADSNRGDRSVDDELDDVLAEDDDLEVDDRDEDADEPTSRSRARTAPKSKPASHAKAKDDKSLSIAGRLVHFVREVVAELQKVIWPTRKELLTYTGVVLFFVAVVMTAVALLDVGFAKTMFLVFGSK
jgi:preprotein translocase subunit SecE